MEEQIIYDIIGDIHGHALPLRRLLEKLGYKNKDGYYTHTENGRKVIFVGDFIDRGPQNLEVLKLIKSMFDHGTALAVLGNHEYNALCYHTPDGREGYLRPHTIKNTEQHSKVLQVIKEKPHEWELYLDWFRQLPLFLELGCIRVIHACWDQKWVEWIKDENIRDAKGLLTDNFLIDSSNSDHPMFEAVETLLKGKEIKLPGGLTFKDKDGHVRDQVRVRWWMRLDEVKKLKHFSDIAFGNEEELSLINFDNRIYENFLDKEETAGMRITFFGHYWLDGEQEPSIQNEKFACLDYSVARKGKLAAYTFRSESKLSNNNFTFVEAEKVKDQLPVE